jgi:AraC-like DNA-binding protein
MSTSDRGAAGPEVAAWQMTSDDNALAEDFYRSAIQDWYCVSQIDPDQSFFTDNSTYRFGDYVIGRGRSVGQTKVRGPVEIRRSGLDSLAVILDLAGMKGDADGRDVNVPAGYLHLRDLARPSAFKVNTVDAVALAMPRDVAPPWMVNRDIHGVNVDGTPQISRLLTGHLMALVKAAPSLSVEEGVTSIEAALVMTERAFRGTGDLTAIQRAAAYSRLHGSAVSLIEQRLHQPDLSIDELIRVLGTSRSTLFRAFASSGGINLYIRNRRLERARVSLLARDGHHPSVAAIGRAHGFVSESHFSRSFQDKFGHRPGASQTPTAPAAPSNPGEMRYDLLSQWLGGLCQPKLSRPVIQGT